MFGKQSRVVLRADRREVSDQRFFNNLTHGLDKFVTQDGEQSGFAGGLFKNRQKPHNPSTYIMSNKPLCVINTVVCYFFTQYFNGNNAI